MKTVEDYLEELKDSYGFQSTYAAGKHVGITPQMITKIRNGGGLSDKNSERLARALKYDPIAIIATSHAQSSKTNEIRNIWLKLAKEKGNK